jgi:hypothetical protein
MFVTGKTRPIETIPGMGGDRLRRMTERVNATMIYYKKYCVSQCTPNTTIIKIKYKSNFKTKIPHQKLS